MTYKKYNNKEVILKINNQNLTIAFFKSRMSNINRFIDDKIYIEDLILLFKKYKNECQYCLKKIDKLNSITIDHIKPLTMGGSNKYKNLTIACRKCNTYKNNMIPDFNKAKIKGMAKYDEEIYKEIKKIPFDKRTEKMNIIFNRVERLKYRK